MNPAKFFKSRCDVIQYLVLLIHQYNSDFTDTMEISFFQQQFATDFNIYSARKKDKMCHLLVKNITFKSGRKATNWWLPLDANIILSFLQYVYTAFQLFLPFFLFDENAGNAETL